MSKTNKIPDFEAMQNALINDAVRYASVEGINFFQDSFYNQGFTDQSFEAWDARAGDLDPGRNILIKSAYLLNSIQVFNANKERITFGSDAEYADIHNNGGTINISVTERSRKYFWYMYNATGNTMYKAMALTNKESFNVVIPKRQFIGESATFMRQLDNWLLNEIVTRFKHL